MSQVVILVDYEPRTVTRVTEALRALDCRVVPAKDVDAAVAACAKMEPRLVLITSVLPRLRVDDAITQLRARAGLRTTPFVVLMSGYAGHDARADAARLGAQDIVSKPFANEELVARVQPLLQAGRSHAAVGEVTRADILDALRRTATTAAPDDTGPPAGEVESPERFTSEQLFGDILDGDSGPVAYTTQRVRVAPAGGGTSPPVSQSSVDAALDELASAPGPTRAMPRARPNEADVDEVLRSSLGDVLERRPIPLPPREPVHEPTAEQLLDDTLSGLQVKVRREAPAEHPPAAPVAPRRSEPAPVEPAAPLAAERPLAHGTAFGNYELLEPIATGGMAEVYRARMRGMEGFEKIVAIKRILPHLSDNTEFVSMFVDEAKLAAQLQHPNIIHIYDLGRIERSYYIAMEYVDGRDLRSLLRLLDEKGTRLPLGLAILIGARLAAALDYAHRKRDLQGEALALVHRDISPQNILISFDGEIKLCDFGIAKAASKASHTRAGALKGKLQYMSPEQAWGKDIDHRSDIFSLGLVIYEMVTGRKAFAGDSELSVLEQVREPHITMPRDIDPAIPPQVERAVMRALRDDRDERYQTAAEFAGDLEGFLHAIRPSPSTVELGSFLAEATGRERMAGALVTPPSPAVTPLSTPVFPTPAPPAPPPVAPPPVAPAPPVHRTPTPAPPRTPTFTPPKPATTPPRPIATHRPPAPELSISASGVGAPAPAARRVPVGLVAALGVVVLAVVGYLVAGDRIRNLLRTAEPTPIPESAVEAVAAPDAAPAGEPVPPPIETPAAEPARPTPARREAPATAVPTPAPAPTVAPTAPPPTAAPPVEPAPTELPAEVAAAIAAPAATAPPPPTQPRTRAGDLVDIALVDTRPVAISRPDAVYPETAKRTRAGGQVTLRALVNERGTVDRVEVVSSTRRDFAASALAAVRQYRYTPAIKDGVPVKVWLQVVLTFTLSS